MCIWRILYLLYPYGWDILLNTFNDNILGKWRGSGIWSTSKRSRNRQLVHSTGSFVCDRKVRSRYLIYSNFRKLFSTEKTCSTRCFQLIGFLSNSAMEVSKTFMVKRLMTSDLPGSWTQFRGDLWTAPAITQIIANSGSATSKHLDKVCFSTKSNSNQNKRGCQPN